MDYNIIFKNHLKVNLGLFTGDEGQPTITMKYLDSGDLHTIINNDGEAEDLDPGKNYLEQYQDYRSSKDNIGRIRKINLKDKVYYYSAFVRDEFGYPKRQH